MEKYLLVDGSNLLFQMFYGMPARIPGPDGRPIQGTLGFVGALLKMIRMVRPTHVGVFFDGECENPRKAMDEAYKANRPDWSEIPEEELPFSQLPDIYAALDCLSIHHGETTCCETDDWMASYARALEGETVLASFDSDYFQLLSDRLSVLRYRGKESRLWTPQTLKEKLGVAPEHYAWFKAMTGDSSDNVPGIPGVGPKTAAALTAQFSNMEEMLANTQAIARPAIRKAVEENRERLRKSYALIRLEGMEPLPFPPEQLRWQYQGQTTMEVLAAIGLR